MTEVAASQRLGRGNEHLMERLTKALLDFSTHLASVQSGALVQVIALSLPSPCRVLLTMMRVRRDGVFTRVVCMCHLHSCKCLAQL
jgi:hypothetical protein